MSFQPFETLKIWLRHTGCVLGKDRGVLGRGNSRMEFRENFDFGLFISQEEPLLISPLKRFLRQIGQGWLGFKIISGLDTCRMHQTTRNSSIRFLILGLTIVGCAMEVQAQNQSREEQIKAVGDSFEAMMLSHLYEQMDRSSIIGDAKDNPFAETPTQKIYKSWLNDEILKKLAKERPLKIGDLVERQLQGNHGIAKRTLVQ